MGQRFRIVTPSGKGEADVAEGFGNVYFVDTVNGNDGNRGTLPDKAFATMEEAFTHIADGDTIYVRGDVREQINAPVGVQGVRIISAAWGNTRHDDGCRWREEATAGNAPLLTLREQGWEVHGVLFVPETGYSAIKFNRQEIAAAMDGSHAIIRNCKFIGNVAVDSAGGIGIEDYGGMHHQIIEDCEFENLVSGIVATNVSIANPHRNMIRRNIFQLCTNDIRFNGVRNWIMNNLFQMAYHASNHPVTVDMTHTADGGSANNGNYVLENYFADAAADVTIAKGYGPATGDVWRNYVANTAAFIVTVPS